MFSRSSLCTCCPSSFAAPVEVDGGERHYEISSADSHHYHQDWCPAAERSPLPADEKRNVQVSGQVAAELKCFTREELEGLIEEQILRRMRENHRTNQLRSKIDQTEVLLNKYRRHLDALQKHINDLSVVSHSYASQPQPDGKTPMRLTRNVGLQARVKPNPSKEEKEIADVGKGTVLLTPSGNTIHSAINYGEIYAASDNQTLAHLDVGLPESQGGSIARSLENRSPPHESTQTITPCSVVLTRSAQLDACAKALNFGNKSTQSGNNKSSLNSNNNAILAVEVDLTLSDEEVDLAKVSTTKLVENTASRENNGYFKSLLPEAQLKRMRHETEVNERSVTSHNGPTDLKRRKICPSAVANQPADGTADSPSHGQTGTASGRVPDGSFQPRVPVIISVTSISTATTDSTSWSSKMAAQTYKPRAKIPQMEHNIIYQKWKLVPSPNVGHLAASQAPPVPSSVSSPRSSRTLPSAAQKAGVLLDLSTKNNERKPVHIILKPRVASPSSSDESVQPVAHYQMPDLVKPKVIIAQLSPSCSNGKAEKNLPPIGELTSLLPSEPANIIQVEQHSSPMAGFKPTDKQLLANISHHHQPVSVPRNPCPVPMNQADKGLMSNANSIFHRLAPSIMPIYPRVQQLPPMGPRFSYPNFFGSSLDIPNAARPPQTVPVMPLTSHSKNEALSVPRISCCEGTSYQKPVTCVESSANLCCRGWTPDKPTSIQAQHSNIVEVTEQQANVSPKRKSVERALPGLMPINHCPAMMTKTHPAPLPARLNYQHLSMSQLFKPIVTINRVPDGIGITWKISNLAKNQQDEITHYELYSYQESPSFAPSSDLWKQVGSIRALSLPMGCTLSKFAKGFRYHFTLRGMMRHGRAQKTNGGPFSEFKSAVYE